MSKEVLLFVVGILVFTSPLISVPIAWKDTGLFVLGGIVMIISLVCRLQKRRHARSEEDTLHVEHRPVNDSATTEETDVTPV